ncbi:MAG: hypothetical protein OEM25_04735 [Gammaproteobacteria bacterium]|nr:hypothetical protein [Gammaproteobacteria bacterium]
MNRSALLGILLAGMLAGCGANVTLPAPTIPAPLIDQIPMSVGLRMPANFQAYIHEEKVYGKQEWSINLGRSNAALFEQLLQFMFAGVTMVGVSDDPQLMPIDALIEPSIDAFEFSTPEQSNTDAFAVWIRYRIKVYDREGKLVSNWPVSAYGKSQTTTLGSSEALQRAAVLAMRDAAALMIMKFDTVTRISSLATPPGSGTPAIQQPRNDASDDDVQATAIEGSSDETS